MKNENIDREKSMLQELIKNDKDLKALSNWINKINIFEILKSGKTEIRHSKVLAWLMSADGNHCLGDAFIRAFVKKVIKNNPDMPYDLFDWAFIDYFSQIVRTEEDNIDIVVRFEGLESKNILVVENKTKTTEHKAGKTGISQSYSYRDKIEKKYADYKKLFVYLTPINEKPEDSENWCVLSYDDVLDVIDTAIDGKDLLPQVRLIIENYCDLIKKNVIGRDDDLFKKCNLVYTNHQEVIDLLFNYCKNKRIKNKDEELLQTCNRVYALYEQELDLIYQNKVDETATLVEKVVGLINETPGLTLTSSSNKTYVMFTVNELNELIPQLSTPHSSWGTINTYHFWLYTVEYKNNKTLKLAFELGGKNLTREASEVHEKIIAAMKPSNKGTPYTFKIIKSIPQIDFNDVKSAFKNVCDYVKEWVEEIKKAIEQRQ